MYQFCIQHFEKNMTWTRYGCAAVRTAKNNILKNNRCLCKVQSCRCSQALECPVLGGFLIFCYQLIHVSSLWICVVSCFLLIGWAACWPAGQSLILHGKNLTLDVTCKLISSQKNSSEKKGISKTNLLCWNFIDIQTFYIIMGISHACSRFCDQSCLQLP